MTIRERQLINRPAVSIIVPVYNTGKYLRQCVDSLLAQKLTNIEIILVDDESPDDAPEICDAYAEKDERIRVIHQANRGLGLSRNSGLEIARGEYVGFIDSDDYVSEEMYQLLYCNAIEQHADISYCSFQRFSGDNQIQHVDISSYPKQKWEGKMEIRQYLLDRVGLPPTSRDDKLYAVSVCGGIFAMSTLDRIGIRFVSERTMISEDLIFDIDVIPECDVIVCQEAPLYYYRHNTNSLTRAYKSDRFDKNVELYHEMMQRLQKTYDEQEIFNPVSRYLLTTARISIIQEMTFSRQHGYKKTIKGIRRICGVEEIREILRIYDYKSLPFKYRVTCSLMRGRLAELLFVLYLKYRT